MSNDLAVLGSALAQYKEAFGDVDFAKQGAGEGLKRLSIKGGMFRILDGKQEIASIEERSLKVIVVNANESVQREYYEGSYQEGVDADMSCWSNDGNTPAADVTKAQSTNCNNCAKNQPGSGPSGGKACRFGLRLAVVLANNPSGDLLGIKLPAKSIFGTNVVDTDRVPFLAYRKLFASNGVPLQAAITEMKFNPKEPVPVLTFRAVGSLDPDHIPAVKAHSLSEAARKAVMITAPRKRAASGDLPAEEAPAPAPAPKAAKAPKGAGNADAVKAWATED